MNINDQQGASGPLPRQLPEDLQSPSEAESSGVLIEELANLLGTRTKAFYVVNNSDSPGHVEMIRSALSRISSREIHAQVMDQMSAHFPPEPGTTSGIEASAEPREAGGKWEILNDSLHYTPPSKEPSGAIARQVKDIFERLSILSDRSAYLEARLEPVSYPDYPTPERGNAEGPGEVNTTSELFRDLVQIESQIASISDRLALATLRLEI